MKNKVIKTGQFGWMKEMDCEKSRGVAKVMKATGTLAINVASKGFTRKPFQGYK
jgi:hypothetical protein